MSFSINNIDTGKKHGECSLFSSLEFATPNALSTSNNPIPDNLPLTINNVDPEINEQLQIKEEVKVCLNCIIICTICLKIHLNLDFINYFIFLIMF